MLCCLMASGCGYRLTGGVSGALSRTLSVGHLVNRTYRADLEADLERALREELARRSPSGVTAGGELELAGTVQSLLVEPASYTASDQIREYRTTITAEMQLREPATGKVLWKGIDTGVQYFPANADLAVQRNSEQQAVSGACRDLAEHLYQQLNDVVDGKGI